MHALKIQFTQSIMVWRCMSASPICCGYDKVTLNTPVIINHGSEATMRLINVDNGSCQKVIMCALDKNLNGNF